MESRGSARVSSRAAAAAGWAAEDKWITRSRQHDCGGNYAFANFPMATNHVETSTE